MEFGFNVSNNIFWSWLQQSHGAFHVLSLVHRASADFNSHNVLFFSLLLSTTRNSSKAKQVSLARAYVVWPVSQNTNWASVCSDRRVTSWSIIWGVTCFCKKKHLFAILLLRKMSSRCRASSISSGEHWRKPLKSCWNGFKPERGDPGMSANGGPPVYTPIRDATPVRDC